MANNNEGVRGLYPSLPTFDLSHFSSKEYLVKDFIENLSQSVQISRRQGPNANAFDPKPYIRTFEAAVARIRQLDDDLAEQESELKEAVRRAEIDHGRRVQELGRRLENTLDEFQRLDVNIGGKAVSIGGELEQLDKQRMRAMDAKFLIECYVEFRKGDSSRLEKMRKSGSINDSIKCAKISRQLMSIAHKLELPSNDNTRMLIEKFSESLEKDLLAQFDSAYRQMDITAMKGCAKMLHDFNGGNSVKALFVNQHEFFITKQHLVTNEVVLGGDIWDKLPDPDADPPPLERSLAEIIEAARMVIIQESSLIKDIFPIPGDVTKSFLQRIFQQTIQQRLELVLEKAETISPLAFLRSLQSAKSSLDTLVDKLKEHSEELNDKDTNNEIASCLDQNLDDLFTPYLEGTIRYIEREKKSLQDLYESILFKFNTFHTRRKKLQNTTMLDRWRTQLQNSTTSARDRVITQLQDTDPATSRRTEQLLRLAGLGSFREKHQNKDEKITEIDLEETDGLLSTDISKRMLKWLAESIGRSLEIGSSSDMPKDASAFLVVLIDNVGLYVETALESCLDFAITAEVAKNEPDISYFSELKSASIILSLMHKTIHTALLPLAQTSLTIRREMSLASHRFFSKVEDRINHIIQKTVDVVLNHATSLLNKQPKRDYRPRDEDVSLMMLQTPTCLAISTFLEKVHATAKIALTGPNLVSFLYEIATGFRTRFLENLLKNSINVVGGISLTKDIVFYQSMFTQWDADEDPSNPVGTGSVKESYELLHEVGNLYVVPAAALKDRLKDGLLAKAKKELLVPYLARREDYYTAGISKAIAEMA
ncbi:Exocyst complex component 5 [Orbilia oligospora]|uniref:Exocyst complex component 5 n=1 Tax=Orbilia oligospora TaxID=2813651 RepID=A0A4Z0XHE7_ORBOL|nr:Exocyst complex component 5 [Orbilia oligospora]KAF3098443.1 Exocyst complex component 5 [Orbilia oligospora]KAF3115098.1 Exocyst complex component 5 [Orbilia oligospora]KAF3120675.1 Exocyst complex component 5 [Orbilia oligospora]KAF3123292.1 Exocyst complex component 5 [Orbilia oligospora]